MPHHLLDIWDVTEPASVAEYQRLARAAIDDILARGRVPLLVGGSGLYVRAVLERLRVPRHRPGAARRGWRRSWPRSARRRCTPGCARADPAAAAAHPARQRPADRPGAGGDRADRRAVHRRAARSRRRTTTSVQIGVDLDTARAGRADRARVDRMWAAGLVDEVRGAGRRRAARRADGQPGARLPAGAAPASPAS